MQTLNLFLIKVANIQNKQHKNLHILNISSIFALRKDNDYERYRTYKH